MGNSDMKMRDRLKRSTEEIAKNKQEDCVGE